MSKFRAGRSSANDRAHVLCAVALSMLTAVVGGCEGRVTKGPRISRTPEPTHREANRPTQPTASKPSPADNSRCHVCHTNYEEEELAVTHARAGVGCAGCHGVSDAHCSDEDNTTPPDIMYPPTKINPSCMTCHPKDKIDAKPHRDLFQGTSDLQKHCTDCHGKHRLNHRTHRWVKT